MAIYSGFAHWKWWFSIVMLVYQRVFSHQQRQVPLPEFAEGLFRPRPRAVEGLQDHSATATAAVETGERGAIWTLDVLSELHLVIPSGKLT